MVEIMKISCVILNYNDYETTTKLINEIQDYSSLDSIVVIDNLSTDESFSKLLELRNSKVHVLQTDRNGGYGYGNNFGIKYAYSSLSSDFVLIANPDVHFTNKTVEQMAGFLEGNPNYAIVAPRALTPELKNQKLIAWKIQKKWDYLLSSSMIYLKYFSNKYYPEKYFLHKDAVDVDVVPGSLLMVVGKYMHQYGMYDEENFLYSEEEMLALKFMEKSLKTRLLLNTTYIHEHSISISKSFPLEISKKKMNLDSRIYTLNNYYNLSEFEKKIVYIVGKISLYENKTIFKIKSLFKK
ncbi:glycosyltransferase [Jeotgalibaca porci]|uniref:glycosyltransferase n=1 Tax=Jeotgalibaca porci TaxID=1868793 RepID=UPI003F8FBF26